MENHLNEGDIVHLKSASIQKGSFVKLQPQTTDFIKISNPKAVLEQSLRSFSALTKGETFRILYNKKKYDIGVVEVRPAGRPFQPNEAEAVCIIEADVEVDFAAPADYVEPKKPSPIPSPHSTSPLQKSPLSTPPTLTLPPPPPRPPLRPPARPAMCLTRPAQPRPQWRRSARPSWTRTAPRTRRRRASAALASG